MHKTKLTYWVLLIVLLTTLAAGLTPRGSFKDNWLSWNQTDGRTVFKEYGMVYGTFPSIAQMTNSVDGLLLNVTLVPKIANDNLFRVIAYIGEDNTTTPLILGQWNTHFIFLQGLDFANKTKSKRFSVDITEHLEQPLKIGVQLHANESRLVINDSVVRYHTPSDYVLPKPDARIYIGNSPQGRLGWSGEISAFKVFKINAQFEPIELLHDYAFNNIFKNSNTTIRNLTNNTAHLSIPAPGRFPKLEVLHAEPIDKLLQHSKIDLALNLLGFVPLGITSACAIYCVTRKNNYALILLGISVCLSVSLIIELLQPYIPGRYSHFHDLILNLSGGVLGVLGFSLLAYIALYQHREH